MNSGVFIGGATSNLQPQQQHQSETISQPHTISSSAVQVHAQTQPRPSTITSNTM